MALTDRWTQLQLRTAARQELLDAGSRWWTDTELNSYIGEWQDELQNRFEFVWGSATLVTSSSTLALAVVSTDMLRLDAIYWNGTRLAPRSKEELDVISQNWRNASSVVTPAIAYQDDSLSVSFWGPPNTLGTVVFEYPKLLTFVTDTDTMQIPAWCRYSCTNYVCWKAYQRAGPNQDNNRALRRKARWTRQFNQFRVIKDNFFADRYMHLKPGGTYEGRILHPNAPLIP